MDGIYIDISENKIIFYFFFSFIYYMDYSKLNNMLSNLEVNSQHKYSPEYVDNKKINTNNLERDIGINHDKKNFELANPQRNNNSNTLYEKFDQCNDMINNYNFAYSQRTFSPNQFIDFTKLNTQEKDKANINDRLNNREFTPNTANKFFN